MRQSSARACPQDDARIPPITSLAGTASTSAWKDAGTPSERLEAPRATVATQLAEVRVRPRRVEAFLSHADMPTTMKYYTAVGDLDDLANHLPDLP